MSTQSNDSSGNAFRDPLHEKLCAWILGEASTDEAREVEAALENDPELRAERVRLEATIGVVQDAFPAQERLSGHAMTALASAAREGARPEPAETTTARRALAHTGPSPWYRSGAFRAAAAVTVALGGTLFASRAWNDSGDGAASDSLARRPLETEAGKLGGQFGEPSASADTALQKARGERGSKDLQARSDEAGRARTQQALAELNSLGYAGGAEETVQADSKNEDDSLQSRLGALAEVEAELTPGESALAVQVRDSGALARVLAVDGRVAGEAAPPARPGAASPTTPVDGEVPETGALSGSDEFFLGHGENLAADAPVRELLRRKESEAAPATEMAAETATRRARGGENGRRSLTEGLEQLGYSREGSDGEKKQEERRSGEAGSAGETVRERRGYVQDFDIAGDADGKSGELDQLLALADDLRAAGGLDRYEALGEDRAGERDVERLLAVPRALDRLRFDRRLSDDELARLAELLQHRYLQDCRRRPQETPRDMYYRWWGDNPFEDSVRDAQSTFSVDVDTASYVLARRYLREGHLPQRAQIRTEEFLNYFSPDLPAPSEGTFAVHTELAPSRYGGPTERWMLRVGVRGKDVTKDERQPLAITFVVDTSGSMRENNRLEVVKHAIRLLLGQLDARDSIGIVAFSSEPRLILPMTSAAQRDLIETALHPLRPDGSTNAEGGLKMGYELARTALDPNVHSRVVFLSDGVANVGQTDQNRISQDVAVQRSQGIYLNTIGVGMNNHNDVFLEQLANKGDGICDYVDGADSARRAIVDRFTGAMIPIASDVKIQVEFDPSRVVRYRLLGYENRAIADKDFRNDAVDAGEVGAGHQVVALYELELGPERDGAPLATVRLRWKEPKATGQHPAEISVTETETAVHWEGAIAAFANASPGFRRSALAAQLAEFLRRSSHAANDSFTTLFEDARTLALEVKEEESVELAELVGKTIELGLPMQLQRDAIETLIDEYRRQQILEARLDALERAQDAQDLRQEIQRRNLELELRLQELLLQELKRKNG